MSNNTNFPVTLFIFSGLPGVGKSTLAKKLASYYQASYIRIDTIECGLKKICEMEVVEKEGYLIAYRLVSDNLNIGNHVVTDSCNPVEESRVSWQKLSVNSQFINIEVICSDESLHKQRIEKRGYPTWDEIRNRPYEKWRDKRIVIDTLHDSPEVSLTKLIKIIDKHLNAHNDT